MSDKMLPVPTPETRVFWDKAKDRELWLPRCVDTGRFFFPPRQFSPFTGGAVEWQRASGEARLASFLVVHRPGPGFEEEVPYIVAIAELREGPHMLTNLPGTPADPAAIRIGAELEVSFEERGEMCIPQFRMVGA
ncbi:MAG: OB-fold domain-containing protein [Novosphingobium sp.]|nr:OB-fold domain-containing protein [Novosphingobium sp.]